MRAFFDNLAQVEDDALEASREVLLAEAVPAWCPHPEAVALLRETLTSPEQIEGLSTFVKDVVHVALHSVLVMIDGGASSAAAGRVHLCDENGASIGEGLHEAYVDYLFETGKMS
jgi:hypothetical protein